MLLLSSELQLGVEQHLLGSGFCETDSQMSPVTAQLYANAALWANHNGSEEANGNEARLLLANEERAVAESNSSGGKSLSDREAHMLWPAVNSKPSQTWRVLVLAKHASEAIIHDKKDRDRFNAAVKYQISSRNHAPAFINVCYRPGWRHQRCISLFTCR